MRIADMNWSRVEDWLQHDDRCVLPVGSTEQHAGLSLCVDNILAERVALEAAGRTGVPVFPPVNYGLTAYFMAFPGTITLRPETYAALLGDILDSLASHGFRRVLVVNGHGGNAAASEQVLARARGRHHLQVQWHNWWKAPATRAAFRALDPDGAHASWSENFPWTRLEGVVQPDGGKAVADMGTLDSMTPAQVRKTLGDGNMGGVYQKPDKDMTKIWSVAVQETRDLLEDGWERHAQL
ncbi:MAG: creatininase family protein [Anaerolineaceae bacterium]|nr:creatininase family protein [Anaerolineaceae bacterium]